MKIGRLFAMLASTKLFIGVELVCTVAPVGLVGPVGPDSLSVVEKEGFEPS